jgi:hypothetical protein
MDEAPTSPADLPPPPIRGRWIVAALLAFVVAIAVVGVAWGRIDPHQPQSVSRPSPAVSISAPSLSPSTTLTPSPVDSRTPAGGRTPGTGRTSAQPPSGPPVGNGNRPSTSPAASAASTAEIGDGTYRVGVDIAAGSWSTGGAVNVQLKVCSYSINGGPATQLMVSVGLTTVHLKAGDRFVTSGCKPWRYT